MTLKTRLDRLEKRLPRPRTGGTPRFIILHSNGRCRGEDLTKPQIRRLENGNWMILVPHDEEAARAFEAELPALMKRLLELED
jgi:hypothetical protein